MPPRLPPLAPAGPRLGLVLLALVTFGAGAACARNPRPGANSAADRDTTRTTVRVQNQGFGIYDVYVVETGVRRRLGTVPAASTAVFTIPQSLVQTIGSRLRFLANPVGGQRQPVSEEITVMPGDQVGLLIPAG